MNRKCLQEFPCSETEVGNCKRKRNGKTVRGESERERGGMCDLP